jgi:hypothetical protein
MIVQSNSVMAAPHIGMKLACKRYGEAFNSGSRGAVIGASTGSFAQQWSRMPADVFASIPRVGGGSKVLGSSKGSGSGTVTVATSQGVVTFVVVGHGFNWTVADIYKAGDDGRTVSLTSYLDLTLTANEFMKDLKYVGGSSFHDSITGAMKSEFTQLRDEELTLIRDFLPEVRRNKPHVVMNGSTGTMRMQVPGGKPHETITFKMVHNGSWKVDDYVVYSDKTKIPSFKNALPLLASVAAFKKFATNPEGIHPASFCTEGSLRDTLIAAKAQTPFPLKPTGSPLEMVLSEDGKSASIRYPDRQVRIEMGESDGRMAIAKIQVRTGDRWAHLDHMLAIKQQIGAFGLFASAARTTKPLAAASVLTTVASIETIPAKTAETVAPATPAPVSRPVLAPVPTTAVTDVAVKPAVAATPVVQSVSHVVREVQPVSYQYQSRREYKRSMRHHRGLFRRR